MQKKEKILVTSALTYANGPLHIGHIAGSYLNADIFVRFKKLQNADIIYIGGTDDHGAPISIKAEEEGISPQELVDKYNKSMREDLEGIGIEQDDLITLLAEGLAGLSAGIIKLAALADDNRP